MPASTILPSAWTATPAAVSRPDVKFAVLIPSPLNEVSSVPSALYRTTANFSLVVPEYMPPAATILPSAWRATALAPSKVSGATSVVTLPSPLYEVSRVPSALYRTTANLGFVPSAPEVPATTILPSPWMTIPCPKSLCDVKLVVTLPSPPNDVSRSPAAAKAGGATAATSAETTPTTGTNRNLLIPLPPRVRTRRLVPRDLRNGKAKPRSPAAGHRSLDQPGTRFLYLPMSLVI
jgi:hypothetical protein